MTNSSSQLSTSGSQTTQDFLEALGLSPQEAALYLTLINSGPLSTLELAKATNIPRSTVYRLLESLKTHQLVEEIVDQHRTLTGAVSPDKLEHLLKNHQAKLAKLHRAFPQVQAYLNQQIESRQNPTHVKFYRGISGVQQMAWHVLEAEHETVGYTQSKYANAVGDQFAADFFEEMYFKNIKMRDIYSDNYLESLDDINTLGQEVATPFRKNFESRYLPQDKLDVIHTMDIYNDVIAIYDYQGDDIFGVEIQNEKVATMQKQIFELLWSLATPEADLLKKNRHP